MDSREPLRDQLVHSAIKIVQSHGNVMKIAALGAELTAQLGASKYRDGLAQAGNKHSVKRALELASPGNTWRFDGHYMHYIGKSRPSASRPAATSEAPAARAAIGATADRPIAASHPPERVPHPTVVSLLKVVANSLRRVSQNGLERGCPVTELHSDAVRSLGEDVVESAIRNTHTTSFSDAIVTSAPEWIRVCIDRPDCLRLRDLRAIPAFVDEPSKLGGGFGGIGAAAAAASSNWHGSENGGDYDDMSSAGGTLSVYSGQETGQEAADGRSRPGIHMEHAAAAPLRDDSADDGDDSMFAGIELSLEGIMGSPPQTGRGKSDEASANLGGSGAVPFSLERSPHASFASAHGAGSASDRDSLPRHTSLNLPRVAGRSTPNQSRLALLVVIHEELVEAPDHIVQMSVLGPLMRAAIRGEAWTELMQSERVKKTTDLIRNLCGRFTDFTFGRMTSGSAELASDHVRLDKFADAIDAMAKKNRTETAAAAAAAPTAAASASSRAVRPRGSRTVTKLSDLDLPSTLKWSRYATPEEVLVMSVCYRLILDTPATSAGLHCSDIGDLGNRAIVLLGRERYMKGTAQQKLGELLSSKGKDNIRLLPRGGKPGVMDAVLRTAKLDALVSSGAFSKGGGATTITASAVTSSAASSDFGVGTGKFSASYPRVVVAGAPSISARVQPPPLSVSASSSASGGYHAASVPAPSLGVPSAAPLSSRGQPPLPVPGHTQEGTAGLLLHTSAPVHTTGMRTQMRGAPPAPAPAPAPAASTAVASSESDYERCREVRLVLRHGAPGSWTPYRTVVKRIGSMAVAKHGESDLLHLLLREGSVEFSTTMEGLMVRPSMA